MIASRVAVPPRLEFGCNCNCLFLGADLVRRRTPLILEAALPFIFSRSHPLSPCSPPSCTSRQFTEDTAIAPIKSGSNNAPWQTPAQIYEGGAQDGFIVNCSRNADSLHLAAAHPRPHVRIDWTRLSLDTSTSTVWCNFHRSETLSELSSWRS